MNDYINGIYKGIGKTDRRYAAILATVLLSVSFCLALIFSIDYIYDLLREPMYALIELIDPSPENELAVRETVSMLVSIIVSALAILLPTLPLRILCGRTPSAVCAAPVKKPSCNIYAYIPFAIGMGYVASLMANTIFGFSDRFANETAMALPETLPGIILYFVYVALLPAITEEIMFRGVIMGSLMPYGRTQALIISSMLFGLTHVNPVQAIFATAMGLLIGKLYADTGSIWWGALIHFLNNALSTALSYILLFYGNGDIMLFEDGGEVLLFCGLVIYALIIFALIYGIVLMSKANKQKRAADLTPPPSSRYRTVRDMLKQVFGRDLWATAIFVAAYTVSLLYRYFI